MSIVRGPDGRDQTCARVAARHWYAYSFYLLLAHGSASGDLQCACKKLLTTAILSSLLTYLISRLSYDAPRLAFPALNKVQARTPRKLARFVDGVSPLAPPRVIKLLQLRWVKVV